MLRKLALYILQGPRHRPELYPEGGKVVEPTVVVDKEGEVITTFLPDMIKVGLMTVEEAMFIGQLVYLVTTLVPEAKQRASIPHKGILCNTGFCWQRHFNVTDWYAHRSSHSFYSHLQLDDPCNITAGAGLLAS